MKMIPQAWSAVFVVVFGLTSNRAAVAAVPATIPATQTSASVDAPALLRELQQHEQWLHTVDSLEVTFQTTRTTTPKGIAKRRKELAAEFPGADMKDDPSLMPEVRSTISVSFDQKRVYHAENSPKVSENVLVWDGHQTLYSDHHIYDHQRSFLLDKVRPHLRDALSGFGWARMAELQFNWCSPYTPEQIAACPGRRISC